MQKQLPIERIKPQFLTALSTHQTLVLSAEPGAGKSTHLPLWLLDTEVLKHQKIYLLQPRRLAAKNIASFLAEQINEPVGQTIGYRLRNESQVSENTRLEVITEGILVQIMQQDPELNGVGLVIIDEFHERSLQADLALAFVLDVQDALRDDLKLLIMSATLASDALLKHIPKALYLECEGRSYPVDITYQAMNNKTALNRGNNAYMLWREHALKVIQNEAISHTGSILVFLPGVADIHYLVKHLSSHVPPDMKLSPLYGDLSIKQQQAAIAPSENGIRKLVLATNIAETSLTIEGINLVIDCGLEKVAVYDSNNLTNALMQRNIAKDAAIQRSGRAGRMSAGRCIRLYAQEEFSRRSEHSASDIQQADLLPFFIEVARWGANQLSDLSLLELPEGKKESNTWQELIDLQLVNTQHNLTPLGKKVARVSCHPRFAAMILSSQELSRTQNIKGLTELACIMAALLEEKDLLSSSPDNSHVDITARIRLWIELTRAGNNQNEHKHLIGLIQRIKQQAQRLAKQVGAHLSVIYSSDAPLDYTGVVLLGAYPERLSQMRLSQGSNQSKNTQKHYVEYLSCAGKGLSLRENDALAQERYIVVAQLSAWQSKLQVRIGASVDLTQLIDLELVKPIVNIVCEYNAKDERIILSEQERVGAMLLKSRALTYKNNVELQAQIGERWLDVISKNGLNWLKWQDKDNALLERWRWLNVHFPNEELPDVTAKALLENLSEWLIPYISECTSKAQLVKISLGDLLLNLLTYEQQKKLSKLVPTHYIGMTGRKCKIRYGEQDFPVVSLPMQELYGMKSHPHLGGEHCQNKVPLILELLSPAQRPIQITQDLPSFWLGSYQAVQKDMKSQYPKHFWPDEPQNSQATRKTKKHQQP